MIQTRPAVPLCAPVVRTGSSAATSRSSGRIPRASPRTQLGGTRSGASVTRPERVAASPNNEAVLNPIRVMVTSARTLRPATSAQEASRPLGRSMDRTGRPASWAVFSASITSARAGRNGGTNPVPSRPSTTTPADSEARRSKAGFRGWTSPPTARRRRRFRRVRGCLAGWASTRTVRPSASRWRAATRASPPLAPPPASSSTGPPGNEV
ncbi:hypothetical protein DESA109040_21550 [Deinococcus saxicola]